LRTTDAIEWVQLEFRQRMRTQAAAKPRRSAARVARDLDRRTIEAAPYRRQEKSDELRDVCESSIEKLNNERVTKEERFQSRAGIIPGGRGESNVCEVNEACES
jgi:hypothetical protein